MVNATEYWEQVDKSGALTRLSTKRLADLLDEFDVKVDTPDNRVEWQARRLVLDALRSELECRYDVQVQAMDSAAIIKALAPIADLSSQRGRSVVVRHYVYRHALASRHAEARLDMGSPEFNAGPARLAVDAVRPLVDQ